MNKVEQIVKSLDGKGIFHHTGDLKNCELEGIMVGWLKEKSIVHSVPQVGDLVSAIITQDGKAVAVAQANIRNEKHALIRAVWTDKHKRGQGLGMKVVSALVQASLDVGLICTTYSNPDSRKIFSDLGFEFGKENRINVAFGTLYPEGVTKPESKKDAIEKDEEVVESLEG